MKLYKKIAPFVLTALLAVLAFCYSAPIGTTADLFNQKQYMDSIIVKGLADKDLITSFEIRDEYCVFMIKQDGKYLDYESDIRYYTESYDFLIEAIEEHSDSIKIIDKRSSGPLSVFIAPMKAYFGRILTVVALIIIWGTIEFCYDKHITKKKKKEEKKNQQNDKNSAVLTSDGDGGYTETESSKVTFADVAGMKEEKRELSEIVDFLKNREKYETMGAKIPRGVLLTGKPGTGKTLLAKAVAGEANVNFISMSGSEFGDKYVGVGAKRVRELFEEAREKAPCIIFIDEIDAIGSRRSGNDDAASKDDNRTLNQLLTELDGFEARDNVIILGATNMINNLDPALLRPGRFDRTIYVSLPDVLEREAILKLHSKNKPLMDDISLRKLAQNTAGFSGAELENLLNEAAILAVRNKHKAISQGDLDEALKKVAMGLEKSNRVMSKREIEITANHEAGHTIVSLFMPTQSDVKEVSIVPRGNAGGYTWHNGEEGIGYKSKTEFKEKLAVLMAGRVAEEIVIGDISTGASQDIKVATRIAKSMVLLYGMDSDVGPVSVTELENEKYVVLGEQKREVISNKITNLLKEAEDTARKLINQNRPLLERLVRLLLEKETVSGEELKKLYNKYISAVNAK